MHSFTDNCAVKVKITFLGLSLITTGIDCKLYWLAVERSTLIFILVPYKLCFHNAILSFQKSEGSIYGLSEHPTKIGLAVPCTVEGTVETLLYRGKKKITEEVKKAKWHIDKKNVDKTRINGQISLYVEPSKSVTLLLPPGFRTLSRCSLVKQLVSMCDALSRM